MSTSHRGFHGYLRLSVPACLALAVVVGFCGADLPVSTSGKTVPAVDTVELFAAVEQGEIEARFIPKNAKRGRIVLKNNTNRPLSVRLPEAFVGVPVLSQFGNLPGMNQGAGRNGFANGNGNNNNANQAVGGPMAPSGNGRNQRRNGFFNIPAEHVMDFEVTTVCLEHGKQTPRPIIPYALRPVESFTSKPAVQALLRIMGDGYVDQRSAQAAAWHLANDMTWEQLAAKRIEHISGSSQPYFAASQLEEAVELVKKATTQADNRSASSRTSSSGR